MVTPKALVRNPSASMRFIRRVIKCSRHTRLPLKGMKMLDKFVAVVKRQISYYEGQVTIFTPDHPRYRADKMALYKRIANELRELLSYLVSQRDRPTQAEMAAGTTERRIAQEDISDLPPELLAELSDAAKGEIDPIIQIIEGRGGTASLDEILIDLFRKHKEIGKRNIVSNKLYRLARRGLCWSVPGKKGFYTTTSVATGVESDNDFDIENNEGSDVSASEPSKFMGVAGLPEGPSKPSPVGSTPTASTKRRQDLLAGAAILSARAPR
jgi:hypothetical protein